MNPIEFQKKWLANTRKERTASQEHFLDLCALVIGKIFEFARRLTVH